jgi:hypothetical protein
MVMEVLFAPSYRIAGGVESFAAYRPGDAGAPNEPQQRVGLILVHIG